MLVPSAGHSVFWLQESNCFRLISDIMQCLSSCTWLILFNITSSRFVPQYCKIQDSLSPLIKTLASKALAQWILAPASVRGLTWWTPVSCCSRGNCERRGRGNGAVGAVGDLSWSFKDKGKGWWGTQIIFCRGYSHFNTCPGWRAEQKTQWYPC